MDTGAAGNSEEQEEEEELSSDDNNFFSLEASAPGNPLLSVKWMRGVVYDHTTDSIPDDFEPW